MDMLDTLHINEGVHWLTQNKNFCITYNTAVTHRALPSTGTILLLTA